MSRLSYPTPVRRLETPRGVLVNLSAIEEKYGIKGATFWKRNQKGWPAKNDASLEPQAIPNARGRPGVGFLEHEVDEVLQPRMWPSKVVGGEWIDEQTFVPNGGHYAGKAFIPEMWFWETYANTKQRWKLSRWRNHCRFRPRGEGIVAMRVPPPSLRNRDKIWVYLREHVEEVAPQLFSEGQPDQTPPDFLPGRALMDLFDKPHVKWDWLNYWANADSKLRSGEKALRREKQSDCRKGPRRICCFYYCVEDARNILAGREGRPANLAIPKPARVSDTKARKIVTMILQEQGPLPEFALYQQVRAKGVNQQQLFRLKTQLHIAQRRDWHGPRHWCLPGQRPPAGDVPEPLKQFMRSCLVGGEWIPKREVVAKILKEGFPGRLIYCAKARLGVEHKNGDGRQSLWRLPNPALVNNGVTPPRLAEPEPSVGNGTNGQSAAAVPIAEAPAPSKGGRPPSPETAMMEKLCYTMRDDGAKYANIRAEVKKQYGRTLGDNEINGAAKHYAKLHGKLFQPRS